MNDDLKGLTRIKFHFNDRFDLSQISWNDHKNSLFGRLHFAKLSCRKLLRICFPSKIYTLIRHCVDKQWETRLFSETHSCLQIFKKNKIYKRNTAPFTASLFTLFHLISMKLNITTNSIADGSSNFDI